MKELNACHWFGCFSPLHLNLHNGGLKKLLEEEIVYLVVVEVGRGNCDLIGLQFLFPSGSHGNRSDKSFMYTQTAALQDI